MATLVPKLCWKCKQEKPLTEFGKDKSRPDGLNNRCLPCSRAYCNEYARKNPEGVLRRSLRQHGITLEQYNEMIESQHGLCASCGNPEPTEKRLQVDHDHDCCPGTFSCGQCIRALVCSRCNKTMGDAHDSIVVLRQCIAYLERWES